MSDLPAMPPPVREPAPPGAPLGPPRRPGWATAIGVISVVLAGMGLICTPISLAMQDLLPKLMPGAPIIDIRDYYPEWYGTYYTIMIFVGLALAVLHLAGGITVLRKHTLARALYLTWAGANLVLTVINIVISLAFMDLSSAPRTVRIATIIGIPVGLAYPVFLLIWFNRAKIKQQVSAW